MERFQPGPARATAEARLQEQAGEKSVTTLKTGTRLWWGAVIALCVTAFIAIALISGQIFEHVPHSEDEVAYLFQAKVLAQNRLAVPTPLNDQAFWSPFVLDYQGRRFGKYPPGWPALLSLGVRLNAPWIINGLLATFTLALIAWLGRCFYQPSTGLWAAGLGIITPGFLFLSSSLLSHTASLFWTTLALVAVYYLTTSSGRSVQLAALLGGLALGMTFITRPFAAVGIGAAIGIFLLALIVRRELKWAALLWLILGGLAGAVLLPLYWWQITGDPTFNAYLLVWPYDRIGFGPDIGPYGYCLHEALFINTRLKLTALGTGLFGWPGWSNLLFLPIPFLTRRAHRWDGLLLGTLAGIIGVHIFYWAFGGVDGGFPRYYYDALPALLLLTARGIQILIDGLARQRFKLGWLPVGLVIILTAYNFIWNLPPLLEAQKGKYNITPAPLETVEQANLSKPALILVKDVTSWSDFAAPFAANSPTLDGPIVYAIDWGPNFNRQLKAQFRDRVCWELAGEILRPCP